MMTVRAHPSSVFRPSSPERQDPRGGCPPNALASRQHTRLVQIRSEDVDGGEDRIWDLLRRGGIDAAFDHLIFNGFCYGDVAVDPAGVVFQAAE